MSTPVVEKGGGCTSYNFLSTLRKTIRLGKAIENPPDRL
jgi:hypothetical protein